MLATPLFYFIYLFLLSVCRSVLGIGNKLTKPGDRGWKLEYLGGTGWNIVNK